MTRDNNSILHFDFKLDSFKNFLFLSTIIEWNNLDSNIIISESLYLFKKCILALIKLFHSNSASLCHILKCSKLLKTEAGIKSSSIS